MVYGLYSISLKLKTPSEEGKKINFQDNEDELLDALHEFNTKYRSWSKRLILSKIEKTFLILYLLLKNIKIKYRHAKFDLLQRI